MANGTMITKEAAQALVDNYRANYAECNGTIKGIRYDLGMLDQLKEAAPEGVEITSVRIYFGMDEENNMNTVLIGCDAEGNNYYGASEDMCLDSGEPCPDSCGANPL